jgi:group I intron endonuclease
VKLIDVKFKDCGGIYKITNTVNGKCYIGRTKCFYRRNSQYNTGFRKKSVKHINEYMLKSMVKYGYENFIFRIIEICEQDIIAEREVFWMDYFNSHDKSFGYNLRNDSDGGMITHPDTSIKISKRLKTEWENGVRDSHGLKLKESWLRRDRDEQSKLMSKTLTKYKYVIRKDNYEEIVLYKKLSELGLKGCISKFFKYKTNKIEFKGWMIERIPYDAR